MGKQDTVQAVQELMGAEEGVTAKTVTEQPVIEEQTQNLLKDVVSRLGLEPRALALKARKG